MAEQIELVKRSLEAWNAGDLEGTVALAHPEIVVDFSAAQIFPGLDDVYRGHDGIRSWWHTFREPFEYFHVTATEFSENGDRVAAAIHWEGRGAASGAVVELDFANAWTLRDGLIVRFEGHHSLQAALEAARVSD